MLAIFIRQFKDVLRIIKLTFIPFFLFTLTYKAISQNLNTTLVSQWSLNNGMQCNSIKLYGERAYLNYSMSGFRIIDISNVSQPIELGYFISYRSVEDIDVAGDTAYVTLEGLGLGVLDISDPGNITQIGLYTLPDYSLGFTVKDGYAYIANHLYSLRIIDVRSPDSLQEVGLFDTLGYAYNVSLYGGYAYISNYYDGILIVDVSFPNNPTFVSLYATGGVAYDITVQNNKAYVADGMQGLKILDVSNPVNPIELGSFDTYYAKGVAIRDNYVYLVDEMDGLRILDVTNSMNPTEVGFYQTSGNPQKVKVKNEYAFVADGVNGFTIIKNDLVTHIESSAEKFSRSFFLKQNYPNPFNPTTTIKYDLPQSSVVSIQIFNSLGEKVKTLYSGLQTSGSHEIVFDGNFLPSGIYFYQITTKDFSQTNKCLLLK